MSRKTKSSEFVSAAGKVFEIVQRLSNAVDDLGGNDAILAQLLSDDQLVIDVARLLVDHQAIVRQTYPIVVDYDKTVEQMLADGAHGGITGSDIASFYYAHQGYGVQTVVAELVHFDCSIPSYDVLKALSRRVLRPPSLAELLALAAYYPNLQREFQIVAPGSDWYNPEHTRWVVCLHENAIRRSLYSEWLSHSQDANVRLLGIHS